MINVPGFRSWWRTDAPPSPSALTRSAPAAGFLALLLGSIAPAQTIQAEVVAGTTMSVQAEGVSRSTPVGTVLPGGWSLLANAPNGAVASAGVQNSGNRVALTALCQAGLPAGRFAVRSGSHSVQVRFTSTEPVVANLRVNFSGSHGTYPPGSFQYSSSVGAVGRSWGMFRTEIDSGFYSVGYDERVLITSAGLTATISQDLQTDSDFVFVDEMVEVIVTPLTRTTVVREPVLRGVGFGEIVANIGDYDADGHDDIAVGHPSADWPTGTPDFGVIRLFSGRDMSQLEFPYGVWPGSRWGTAIAGGDVDDSGDSELIFSGGGRDGLQRGELYFLSNSLSQVRTVVTGQPGEELGRRLATGVFDAVAGADVVVTRGSDLEAFNIWTRASLWPAPVTMPAQVESIGNLGDVNGDGYDDVIVGMPTFTNSTAADRGRVEVLSGRDGGRLWVIGNGPNASRLGQSVAGVGDLDGDGIGDAAVGVPGDGANRQGRVNYYDGATGAFLNATLSPIRLGRLGTAVAAAGDVDFDGVPDVLVSSVPEPAGTGQVFVLSGANPTVAAALRTRSGGATFGSALAGAMTNGDALPDFVVGEPGDGNGSATIFDSSPVGSPPWQRTYGAGCRTADGRQPRAGLGGRPVVGRAIDLKLWAVSPSSLSFLALGTARATPLPLDPFGLRGCLSHVDNLLVHGQITDSRGRSQLRVTIPSNVGLIGTEWAFEWFSATPSGSGSPAVTTNAVIYRIGAE